MQGRMLSEYFSNPLLNMELVSNDNSPWAAEAKTSKCLCKLLQDVLLNAAALLEYVPTPYICRLERLRQITLYKQLDLFFSA